MLKLVHIADVHLEKSLRSSSYPISFAKDRREDLWSSLNKVLGTGGADLVLVCGDLFEEEFFTRDHIFKLEHILANHSEKKIIICPGNHDPLWAYKDLSLPDNVYLFTSDTLDYFEFADIKTRVYGLSWLDRSYGKAEVNVDLDPDYINILMTHGDALQDSGPYRPIDIDAIEKLGFTYIALGHIHKPMKLTDRAFYPGCLEPTDFGEEGPRGYMEVILGPNEYQANFVESSIRKFTKREIILDPQLSERDILNVIRQASDSTSFQRIRLKGLVSMKIYALMDTICQLARDSFYYVEFINDTSICPEQISHELRPIVEEVFLFIEQNDMDEKVIKRAKEKFINLITEA